MIIIIIILVFFIVDIELKIRSGNKIEKYINDRNIELEKKRKSEEKEITDVYINYQRYNHNDPNKKTCQMCQKNKN